MKCIRCGHDSKYKERSNRRCPACKGEFAFEPQLKDPVTDLLFRNAIAAVSADGRIRWGVEHLYYEVCRRKRRKAATPFATGIAIAVTTLLFMLAMASSRSGSSPRSFFLFASFFALLPTSLMVWSRMRPPWTRIAWSDFERLWQRWRMVHGTPAGLIVRRTESEPPAEPAGRVEATVSMAGMPVGKSMATFGKRTTRVGGLGEGGQTTAVVRQPLEPDLASYSFDRAVICDRARTVDVLVANNFHFENNCAILSIDGYPRGRFETIKAMIKRNPRILVVTLHDATPEGCRLAHRIAYSPDWFDGKHRIIDLGLRPNHAGPYHGLLIPSIAPGLAAVDGIGEGDARWLRKHHLELAAVRPEQVLKRLYRGLMAHESDGTGDGGVTNCSSFDSGSTRSDSEGSDGGDGFG